MYIAEINMTWLGSTGQIMLSIAEELRKNNINAQSYSPHELSRCDLTINITELMRDENSTTYLAVSPG